MAFSRYNIERAAEQEYSRILRQAIWRGLRRQLGKKCNDLVSLPKLLEQAQIAQQYDLGIQQVPVERIVGSARARDFDLAFNPKRRESDGRWLNIARVNLNGLTLPPPRLVKIDQRYLVMDGNHRISVAQALGRTTINALVVEINVENLEPNAQCSRLGFRMQVERDSIRC